MHGEAGRPSLLGRGGVALAKESAATLSPDARRRRGSLHYKRTGSLADVAELLGDSKRVAADHYVYALFDYREVDERSRSPAPRPRTRPNDPTR